MDVREQQRSRRLCSLLMLLDNTGLRMFLGPFPYRAYRTASTDRGDHSKLDDGQRGRRQHGSQQQQKTKG